MKKIVTLMSLTLLALTLAGCEDNKTQEQVEADIVSHITEFNYKGHHYLMYRQPCGYQGYAGITHDPDCPCHQKGGDR